MEAVKIPSRSELVQRVADIVPVLRANAEWGDRNRRLADESVNAMIDAGVLRMLVPTQYGGYESDMQTIVDVGIQLGRGDGSPAFCATAWWAQCWAVAHFPDSVQDEVFASPDVRICGTLVPNGKGEITKDGAVVSGEWGFNSGAWHSQWKFLSTPAINAAGEIEPIAAVVPMSDLEIVDDWDVAGLRGTGSITLVARDVFIPRERFQWLGEVARQEYGSERNADSPCYRGPIVGVLSNINTGKQVGLAQAAREAFFERIHHRPIQHTSYATQAEWPITHLQAAEADLKIDEAEYHARTLAALVDHKNYSNEPYTMRERAYCRVAVGRVSQLCHEAVNIYNMASGAGGIYSSMPIQRIQRDIQAISLHALNMPIKNLELYGRVLCGLEPNTFFI
ncbi:MAG TPA: acyl-CoA dehydrogenase family protein [Streptosporangiaceae bacterium]|nr:acyl-CoA dehydrogenase family protein [Streptosporangiaceae bacterium]